MASGKILDLRKVSMFLRSESGIQYLDMPFIFLCNPSCLYHLMLEFDIFHASVLLCDFLPILVDISRLGVELRPFVIGLKCELVCMSRNICTVSTCDSNLDGKKGLTTSTTRVSIFKPSPRNI